MINNNDSREPNLLDLINDWLADYQHIAPHIKERIKEEERNNFRHSIANRILTIVEEVYWVIDNPCSALVGQVLW